MKVINNWLLFYLACWKTVVKYKLAFTYLKYYNYNILIFSPTFSIKLGPNETVAMMDMAEIDVAFISGWSRHGKTCISNERVSKKLCVFLYWFVVISIGVMKIG